MNFLFMVGIAPTSWRLGTVRSTPYKVVYALGPFRLAIHKIED